MPRTTRGAGVNGLSSGAGRPSVTGLLRGRGRTQRTSSCANTLADSNPSDSTIKLVRVIIHLFGRLRTAAGIEVDPRPQIGYLWDNPSKQHSSTDRFRPNNWQRWKQSGNRQTLQAIEAGTIAKPGTLVTIRSVGKIGTGRNLASGGNACPACRLRVATRDAGIANWLQATFEWSLICRCETMTRWQPVSNPASRVCYAEAASWASVAA